MLVNNNSLSLDNPQATIYHTRLKNFPTDRKVVLFAKDLCLPSPPKKKKKVVKGIEPSCRRECTHPKSKLFNK